MGVTDALQMGTGLSADLLGFLNLGAKLALGQIGPVALALPVSLAYPLAESMLYLAAGLAISLQAGPVGFHSELALRVLSALAPSASFGLVYKALESVPSWGKWGPRPSGSGWAPRFSPFRPWTCGCGRWRWSWPWRVLVRR